MSLVYLKQQAAAIGARARQMGSLADMSRASLVDVKAEAARWKKTVRAWYVDTFMRAGGAGVRVSKGEIPDLEEKADLFNITDARARALDDMILRSGTKISESTMKIVEDLLKRAEEANQTVEEFTQDLIAKLDEFAQFRCRTIARTETSKVENWGQTEGYKETEFVTKKGWMSAFTETSRETHMAADGQEVGLDEDFNIGGDMMAYPSDPKGEAKDVINCLCTTYPVVD
jgi:polyhydroxyalkanoate synthesis regulator phasin